ncbi:protein SRC2-like [Euphorbia lathyris]|uniref:protein SRC2-like n=1 Tax=Euphorbia lathyris TaxID=212925 RepID=UPI003313598C
MEDATAAEGWKSLELKLISCRDLKTFNFFQKLSVYAVVSIFNDEDNHRQCTQTPVDGEGGGNPEWNQVMQFDLRSYKSLSDDDNLFLKFKLRCDGGVFGKRSIGEVRVLLKDLIEEFNGSVRFLSYQVRNSDGKANGVLNFSYEFKEKKKVKKKEENECGGGSGSAANERCSLYPSLDDIRSTCSPADFYCGDYRSLVPSQMLPEFAVAHGVYHPSTSPLVQHPRPFWYTTQTLAYGYNVPGIRSYPS